MQKKAIVLVALLTNWVALLPTANAQIPPDARNVYQITAGAYTVIGTIFGGYTARLPYEEQAFVTLVTNGASGRAELKILEQDQRTIFLSLTNGLISGNVIRFQYETRHPYYPAVTEPGTLDYTVRNEGGTLRIDGDIVFPPICCDIPHYFGHTNVAASAMPVVAIRFSEVELCWASESNRTYQVQYRTDLAPNVWTNLGLPITATGPTSCTSDHVAPGQAQRFYRVLVVP